MPVNRERSALKELDNIIKSERLGKVFDVLEPRARSLAKQPSSVSFGVLGGALFLVLGLVFGQLASSYLHFSTAQVYLSYFAFVAGGIATGNLTSIGRRGLRLERRGRAIERFIRPFIPVLVQLNQKPATRQLAGEVREAIISEINSDSPKELPTVQTVKSLTP